MTDFKAKMYQIRFDFGWGFAPDPAGELSALPRPPSWIWGAASRQGRDWAGEEEGKGEGKGREGEVEGRKREGPKLLLNQGPSEPCYATAYNVYWMRQNKYA